jgi:hypothetical protein
VVLSVVIAPKKWAIRLRDPVTKTAHPAERHVRKTLLTLDSAIALTAGRNGMAKKTSERTTRFLLIQVRD